MSKLLSIDWIEEIRRQQESEAGRYEKQLILRTLTKSLVESQGLSRFEKILREIRLQAVHCKEIGVTASLEDVTRKADEEKRNHVFRVSVAARRGWAATSYLDLSYTEGESKIRCFPGDDDGFTINLLPTEEGVLTLVGPKGEIKSEEDAATLVFKPLVKKILNK